MTFTQLTAEQQELLQRFLPIRISIRPTPDGKYEGVVEHSFGMEWHRERVNIWWSGKAYSMLGEHLLDAVEETKGNTSTLGGEIWDPLDAACPVEVNFAYWLAAITGSQKRSRYDKRNAPFAVRDADYRR